MNNLWRALDTAAGCWDRLTSVFFWLLLNALWVVMLGGAYYYGETSWSLAGGGAAAEGVVVALKESGATHDSGVTYAPVIRYEVGGRGYTFESDNSSDPPSYKVGERVEILYDRADPARARVNSWFELWLVPVLLGGAALVVAVAVNALAVASVVRGRRSRAV